MFGHENELGNRFLSKSVGKWIFDMEFVVFFHESSPNQELSHFWLINEIFNFLFLNICLVTKMSWEIDFYQNRLENGMEFVVFFHESSPNQELSRFWLINEIFNFLFLNKCLVTKMSWEIDFYQNRFENGFLTWNL